MTVLETRDWPAFTKPDAAFFPSFAGRSGKEAKKDFIRRLLSRNSSRRFAASRAYRALRTSNFARAPLRHTYLNRSCVRLSPSLFLLCERRFYLGERDTRREYGTSFPLSDANETTSTLPSSPVERVTRARLVRASLDVSILSRSPVSTSVVS